VSSSPVILRALSSRAGLRRVLAAYSLYSLIEMSAWLAVVLYAFQVGGATLAGITSLVQLIPAAFLSPAIAGSADSMNRGKALVLAHAAVAVFCALTWASLAAGLPIAVVVLCSSLVTIAIASVRPIHFSTLPTLSDSPDQLVSANSLSSAADGAARFIGPIATGFVFAIYGPTAVFVALTIFAVTATVLCLGLGLTAPPHDDEEGPGWKHAFQGIAALRGDWSAIALLLVLTFDFMFVGAVDILAPALSEDVLGQGNEGAGLIVGGLGIGLFVGAFFVASFARRRRLAPIVLIGAVLEGMAFAAVSQVLSVGAAMTLLALCGIGGALFVVAGRTLLQRATDETVLARVFAVAEGTTLLGQAVGAVLAPIFIVTLGPAKAFVPFGIGATLIALAAYLSIRKLDDRAVYRPEETALLRRVPFLSVLPPYELERLASDTVWMDVEPDTVVVRQGDPGREFYVVESGELSVVSDGQPRPALGPGEGFGEIALLHSVPRTATVTAVTAARLLVVHSEDFLAAVTGSEDGNQLAREIAAARAGREFA
jgi:predicted MFS family arabinose efflux permease